jgi:Zn-finger nucleic acid-binding protein
VEDVCQNCGGIWFDWMELRRLDETKEGDGEALKEALNAELKDGKSRGNIQCPKCGVTMKKHAYRFNKDVEIDECYACGGIFLDSGELRLIREGFMNESKRKEFLNQLLNGIPEYQKEQEKNNKREEAVNNFANIIDKVNIKIF